MIPDNCSTFEPVDEPSMEELEALQAIAHGFECKGCGMKVDCYDEECKGEHLLCSVCELEVGGRA